MKDMDEFLKEEETNTFQICITNSDRWKTLMNFEEEQKKQLPLSNMHNYKF